MIRRPLRSRQPVPGGDVQSISLMIGGDDRAALGRLSHHRAPLGRIAHEKHTSPACVVRDAVTRPLVFLEGAPRSIKPRRQASG